MAGKHACILTNHTLTFIKLVQEQMKFPDIKYEAAYIHGKKSENGGARHE
ncbi:hypothetical protein B14911_25365 [Bacillus sp. NRRL B-14911]|uniref:Uncharacterized protein n=1 Tax=Bacillus infantis NRRL B-14911 TaxID=1367477 RepID=U5LDU2_9BACI|nr:hypothetical protein N288_14805 [Bacillus infantis NRRL B-14911]EAR68050.1 hypothetical protein B14911_25365 [Bacillus sp. NRRL B-14911]